MTLQVNRFCYKPAVSHFTTKYFLAIFSKSKHSYMLSSYQIQNTDLRLLFQRFISNQNRWCFLLLNFSLMFVKSLLRKHNFSTFPKNPGTYTNSTEALFFIIFAGREGIWQSCSLHSFSETFCRGV